MRLRAPLVLATSVVAGIFAGINGLEGDWNWRFGPAVDAIIINFVAPVLLAMLVALLWNSVPWQRQFLLALGFLLLAETVGFMLDRSRTIYLAWRYNTLAPVAVPVVVGLFALGAARLRGIHALRRRACTVIGAIIFGLFHLATVALPVAIGKFSDEGGPGMTYIQYWDYPLMVVAEKLPGGLYGRGEVFVIFYLFVPCTIMYVLVGGVIGSACDGIRLWFMPGAGEPTTETHVRCPDCAEWVRKKALVCKHCGRKLIPQ